MSVKFVSASRNTVSIQRNIIETCLNLCNSDEVPLQVCAYYCSAISAFIPGLKGMAIDALKSLGIQIVQINETELHHRSRYHDSEEEGLVLVHLCLAILILYYDNLQQSYAELMRNWTASLMAEIACYVEHILENEEFAPMIRVEKAVIIRNMLGGMDELKANILVTLLANRDDSKAVGRACSYLARVLSWTGMAVPKVIGDTLLINGSGVLTFPEVRGELHNLHAAFTKINQSSMPQYYGIMYPSSSRSILNESLFPTLYATGWEILKSDGPDSVRNRQLRKTSPQSEESLISDELVKIYRRWMKMTAQSAPTVRPERPEDTRLDQELVTSVHPVMAIYTNRNVNFLLLDRLHAYYKQEMMSRENRS